jgi:RNA polymerase sigma-70 factor (ECF subfamily)
MDRTNDQEKRFIEAFNEYNDALFRHAFFRVSDRQVSIDLVQETYTKTWLHITRGTSVDNFQAFLYHVLNNLIIDFYRKKKSTSLDVLSEEGFDPIGSDSQEIIDSAEKSQIMKALEDLSKGDRLVIVMRYIDGLPVKHIASVLGESENAVSVRLHRAIKKVQSKFPN